MPPRIRSFRLVTLLCLAGLATIPASCSTVSPEDPDDGEDIGGPPSTTCTVVREGYGRRGSAPVRAETVASGLEVPWGIAFLPDGDILVTERPGRIRLIRNGALIQSAIATLPTVGGGEGGLLGIAAHPNFEDTRYIYVYFTTLSGGVAVNRVQRWLVAPNGLTASPDKIIVDGIPASSAHNGGRLRFGPDGMLYVSTGDAGTPDDAQDPASLSGKVLRLTPEGGIPADNPDPESPVYLSGLRNSQGFDWPANGRMWIVDHGPSGDLGRTGHDEINSADAGENLGWPDIYGCESAEGMVTPSLTWENAVPPGGAAIYTGNLIPEWQGRLMVGTLGSRHFHVVGLNEAGRLTDHEVYFEGDPPEGLGRLRDVVMGPDGHVYVTTSNCDGRGTCPAGGDQVIRIVPE